MSPNNGIRWQTWSWAKQIQKFPGRLHSHRELVWTYRCGQYGVNVLESGSSEDALLIKHPRALGRQSRVALGDRGLRNGSKAIRHFVRGSVSIRVEQ